MTLRRKVLVIGIGAGNPDHLTVQAIEAMNRARTFFIPDKGAEKEDLARIRRDICERFIVGRDYRLVPYTVPQRRPGGSDYEASVSDWHDRVAERFGRLLLEELGDDDCGAFLVWGDPTLYDSTMRILDRLEAAGGLALEYEVIPGISAVQALAAAHRVPLNTVNRSVVVTTGRRLGAGFPDDADSVVVMLDVAGGLSGFADDADIWWGGNIGTPAEVLIAGRLEDVRRDIERTRAALRETRGWAMETALLRRPVRR